MTSSSLAAAYDHCLTFARQHYENFPVASWLLPAHLRKPVAVIYIFARTADDLADEGHARVEQRLAGLNDMQARLQACAQGQPGDQPLWLALSDVIQKFQLPVELFTDLLSAFRQDIQCQRYADFNQLLDYCRRSANPVGRLMLRLHGRSDTLSLQQSDDICTALQLINFYQDLQQDYQEMNRIYLPLDEMAACGVSENHIAHRQNDDAMRRLMQQQYARAEVLLGRGTPLGKNLPGRFGLEIRLIIAGGQRILHRLKNQPDLFSRPRLRLTDKLWMLLKAL